jgi:anti-anti-sigma factor
MFLTMGTLPTLTAKKAVAGTNIPVVFAPVINPVEEGVVDSDAQPGGNVTGVQNGRAVAKILEWLHKLVPQTKQIHVLYHPQDAVAQTSIKPLPAVTSALGIELVLTEVQSAEEAMAAIQTLPEDAALFFAPTPSLEPISALVEAATKRGIPVGSQTHAHLQAGALVTYAARPSAMGEQAARMADQILKGAKPGDLPVETAEFFLHINMKSAEAIGLDVPEAILRQAQETLLSAILLETEAFDELALLDRGGREVVRVGRNTIFTAVDLRDRSHEEAVVGALNNSRPYYSGVHFSQINSEPLMQIVVPIVDVRSGHVDGAVSAEVRLKPVWDVVADIQFGEQGTIAIADAAGRVIAHRDPSVVLRGTVIDNLEAEGIAPGVAGGDVVRTSTSFTVDTQVFYAVAELPLAEATNPAYQTVLTTSALLLITLFVAAGIGFVAIHRVVRPVHGLAATARAISAGDLSRNAAVTSRDELGDLATAFNTMTSRLRHLLVDLEQQVADRTAALETALNEVQARVIEQERLLAENIRQREMIRGLSVPVLPISSHTLVMPLVGELDNARLRLVQEQALQALAHSSARHLVLDITGIPIVDSQIAQGLLEVVQAARLLGAKVVLVGIRPEVAQTIVGLGIDLQGTRTFSDLQTALGFIAAP